MKKMQLFTNPQKFKYILNANEKLPKYSENLYKPWEKKLNTKLTKIRGYRPSVHEVIKVW